MGGDGISEKRKARKSQLGEESKFKANPEFFNHTQDLHQEVEIIHANLRGPL